MKKFLLFLFIFVFSQSVFADICREYPPPIVNFYRSEAIFIGKILSIKRYYGIPKTEENSKTKYKIVEFEVQKAYKGVEAGKKISIINPYGSLGWADLKIKKGQQWAIYVNKFKGNLILFNGCSSWSKQIKDQKDFDEWDEYFTTLKNKIENDKQAIVGRLYDQTAGREIQNHEIYIDGNNEEITVKTDKEGRFYVPVKSAGEYTIKIKFPKEAMLEYYSRKVKFGTDGSNGTLIYKINLQSGELNYTDLAVVFSIN